MNDDLISREEVLNKLNVLDQKNLYLPCHFKEFVIDEVPSVETRTGHMTKTGNWSNERRRGEMTAKEKTIDVLCFYCGYTCEEMAEIVADCLIQAGLIKNDIESEQKQGKWIANEAYDGDVYYTCSRCKEQWVTIDGTPQENRMKYCPHCGAKMKGETE